MKNHINISLSVTLAILVKLIIMSLSRYLINNINSSHLDNKSTVERTKQDNAIIKF